MPIEPTHVDHGLLIAQVKIHGALLPFLTDEPNDGVIAQVDSNGDLIPGKTTPAATSNEGALYFLDLPPGRYLLQRVSFFARGARYEVELSSASMRRYTIDLGAGKVAFLGEIELDGRFPDFDIAVEHALSIGAHWLTPFLRRPRIVREVDIRSHMIGLIPERQALIRARKDLAGSQWTRIIHEHSREIGAPEPVPREGALFTRELPRHDEEFFSWRDTLKWGRPARARGGLSWRHPGGEARIAVFFTTANALGFVGYQEAIREMRAAANSLEDSASLYEVRVGTLTGLASHLTSHFYPEGTLTGSELKTIVTETVLVDRSVGMYTARLRAPSGEFEKTLPHFREFLLQLTLARPAKGAAPVDYVLPP